VYSQVQTLMSFCYPRKTGAVNKISTDLGNVLDFYTIPGPNPFYPVNKLGDYLNISIGKFFMWEACYITNMQGFMSSSLGADGHPNFAEITMTFRTMDSQFVDEDGSFNAFRTKYEGYMGAALLKAQATWQAAQESVVKGLEALS